MGATAADPGPPGRYPFARLVAELLTLSFEPQPSTGRHHRQVYRATDSQVSVILVSDPAQPHVLVTGGQDEAGRWWLRWSSHTPQPAQLIALYAALNDDPTAALDAAREALR